MKLNAHRTVTAGSARRWPRLNAGSRLQVELPMTGIRHFRAGAAAVKRDGQAVGVKGWFKSHFLGRAGAAARSVNPSRVSIRQPALAAA